jgi:hypothetical protein
VDEGDFDYYKKFFPSMIVLLDYVADKTEHRQRLERFRLRVMFWECKDAQLNRLLIQQLPTRQQPLAFYTGKSATEDRYAPSHKLKTVKMLRWLLSNK